MSPISNMYDHWSDSEDFSSDMHFYNRFVDDLINRGKFYICERKKNNKNKLKMLSYHSSNRLLFTLIFKGVLRNTDYHGFSVLLYLLGILEVVSKQLSQRRILLESFVCQTTYRWSDFTLSINKEGRNCWTWIKPAIAGNSLWCRRVFNAANFCPRLPVLSRFTNFELLYL